MCQISHMGRRTRWDAGNWLPVGRARRFALVLRLYDSPLSATAGGIEKAAAPQIVRESCA